MSAADTPRTMQAMVLTAIGQPLVLRTMPRPRPAPHQLLLRVRSCGVCRTDLHIFDGDLAAPGLPRILGHEIVGEVVDHGSAGDLSRFPAGSRVGVPWLGQTCGTCRYCREGQENLCDAPVFTGYQRDGGYAEYAVADQRFAFPLPASFDDLHAAPLLCAGLIGYRSYRLAGSGRRLGLYGFGAAAHVLAQIAVHQGREVYAFTKPGDADGQAFARRLGAVWAGPSDARPPVELDAAILFAPVGALVPIALAAVRRGGVVVCAGIHMSDIPAFPYELLWGERVVRSVANLTRRDGDEFLALAAEVPLSTHVEAFELAAANSALEKLRSGKLTGAAVLVPGSTG